MTFEQEIQAQREACAEAGFQKAFEQISIFSVNNGIKELDEFHVTEIAIRVKNAILNAQV